MAFPAPRRARPRVGAAGIAFRDSAALFAAGSRAPAPASTRRPGTS